MRVAVIYRPKNTPPVDQMADMFRAMGEWVQRYQEKAESIDFFVGGGGMGVFEFMDEAELYRMVAEHPFTPFADVEIRPVVTPDIALRTLQEAFAARAAR